MTDVTTATLDVDDPFEDADVGRPVGTAFWAGAWSVRRDLPVLDPVDGSVVGWTADVDADEVDAAVRGLCATVGTDDARGFPLWRRREVLERASVLVTEHAERLARLASTEGSKTLREARAEVARCAETLRLSAAASHVLEGATLPLADTPRGSGRVGWSRRVPVGVVAAITPFNDPLNLVAHKLGPALVGGSSVVLKPSEHTPLSALCLVEILLTAGLPPDRVAVVTGGAATAAALVDHPGVDLVSFTGGPRTAEAISRRTGGRKLLLELGGNNPVVVCADADVDRVGPAIAEGAFGAAGQNCLSVQRVYVHASRHDELVDAVVTAASGLRVGPRDDLATQVGPMIDEREARRVHGWIEEARTAGATVRHGGERHGAYVTPTVLTDVPVGQRVLTDEVFGPVVSIVPFDDLDDAVALANDAEHALHAGVFTDDVAVAMSLVDRIVAGAVLVNDTSDFRIDAMPFGGFKGSGVGREGVEEAVREMTAPKVVILRTA